MLKEMRGFVERKNDIQTRIEDMSKAIADSSYVRAVLVADDECEKLNLEERVSYLENLHDHPEVFLVSQNCSSTNSLKWFKACVRSELQVAKSSLKENTGNTSANDILLFRAKSWAYAMLCFLYEPLQLVVNQKILENTALRGLALAIMDDAEDWKDDRLKGEHTIFTLYPETAGKHCLSVLCAILEHDRVSGSSVDFLEHFSLGYNVLRIFCSAAILRCLQFNEKIVHGDGIFDVRHFLKSLS